MEGIDRGGGLSLPALESYAQPPLGFDMKRSTRCVCTRLPSRARAQQPKSSFSVWKWNESRNSSSPGRRAFSSKSIPDLQNPSIDTKKTSISLLDRGNFAQMGAQR